MRLSDAQKKVLVRLASGDEAWTVSGIHAHAFWFNAITDRRPSMATLHVLNKAGLIENRDQAKFGGAKYVITEAGRRALSEQEAG